MNVMTGTTWALVADGARARLFRLGRKAGDFQELRQFSSPARKMPSRVFASDASSRSRHVAGIQGSHTKLPRTDPHEQAEKAFVQAVVKIVSRSAHSGAFDHLVIAADPRTLGTLRGSMPRAMSDRVCRELDLDLTGLAQSDIEQRLRRSFELD